MDIVKTWTGKEEDEDRITCGNALIAVAGKNITKE